MSAARQLLRLLATAAPLGTTLAHDTTRRWASAIFTGERHRFVVTWDGEPPTPWLDELADWDAGLSGYVAIDCIVRRRDTTRAEIEVLVIDEA